MVVCLNFIKTLGVWNIYALFNSKKLFALKNWFIFKILGESKVIIELSLSGPIQIIMVIL